LNPQSEPLGLKLATEIPLTYFKQHFLVTLRPQMMNIVDISFKVGGAREGKAPFT
jgi:hypothetical protein